MPLELEAHDLRGAGDGVVAYAVPECQQQMALRCNVHSHFAVLGIAQFGVRGGRTHGGCIGEHEDVRGGYTRQQIAEFLCGLGKVARVLLGRHRQRHDHFTPLSQRNLGDKPVSAFGQRRYHAQGRGRVVGAQVGEEPCHPCAVEREVRRFEQPMSDHPDDQRQWSLRRTYRALCSSSAQGFGRENVRQALMNCCRAASESISPASRPMRCSQSGAWAAARFTKCCARGPM